MLVRANGATWPVCVFLLAGVVSLGVGAAARADTLPLAIADDNSTAMIDPTSQAGMYSWIVDGTEHLYQQWFWYRANDGQRELSLDTLTLDAHGVSDPDFDDQNEVAYVRYLLPGIFKIEVYLLLNGGNPGSGVADISESIEITNLSTTQQLAMHFFQYCDFDLCGTLPDDGVVITGGNTARQWQGQYVLSETVETPVSSHYEASFFNGTLAKLNDAAATTLNDNAGPLGPGDLTWAFQWDFTLGPGRTYMISKDKLIVPEPGTLGLVVVGGVLTLMSRRRRR